MKKEKEKSKKGSTGTNSHKSQKTTKDNQSFGDKTLLGRSKEEYLSEGADTDQHSDETLEKNNP